MRRRGCVPLHPLRAGRGRRGGGRCGAPRGRLWRWGRDGGGQQVGGTGEEGGACIVARAQFFERLHGVRESIEPDGLDVVHGLGELHLDLARGVVGDDSLDELVELGAGRGLHR
ncbi:hypothetical protein L1887_51416 [Cichorium endivia]|nr:hypothetical protein L1887_51416 [Cichorium endivia]